MTNIRASLGELCLRKAKGTWAPSTEALRAMLQQKKFTDLSGTAEQSGDLKSVVLHSMTLASVKSDFEVPLGVKISGVDNSTYSLTGEAFSAVVAPKTESNVARVLQKDDVALGKFAHAAVRRTQLQAYHRVVCSVRVHSLRVQPQVCKFLSRRYTPNPFEHPTDLLPNDSRNCHNLARVHRR